MTNVAGVELDAKDVPSLVERQLSGGGVWSDRADYNEVDGLRRAMRQAGDLLGAFGKALVPLLEHDDVRVRTGAVAALGDAAGQISADRVVEILERAPGLFRGVAPTPGLPVQGDDLEAALANTIARLVRPGDSRATTFLRDYLTRSGSIFALLGLAESAPEWVVSNAAAIVPRTAIGGVLRLLPERSQRRAVVAALAPWPADEAGETVAKSFWSTLPMSDDERSELKALIRGA